MMTATRKRRVINLIVEAVNDVPTLDALIDITRNEGDGEQTVSLTGITAGGGETQLLSITAVSDNAGLIPIPQLTSIVRVPQAH